MHGLVNTMFPPHNASKGTSRIIFVKSAIFIDAILWEFFSHFRSGRRGEIFGFELLARTRIIVQITTVRLNQVCFYSVFLSI
jgi:hypothetical protein